MRAQLAGVRCGRRVRGAVAAGLAVGTLVALTLMLREDRSTAAPSEIHHHARSHRGHEVEATAAYVASGGLPRCGGDESWPTAFMAGEDEHTCLQLCFPPEWARLGRAHGARFGKSCVDDFGCDTFLHAEEHAQVTVLAFRCPEPVPPEVPFSPPPPPMPSSPPPPSPPLQCMPARTGDARLSAYPTGFVEVFREAEGASGEGARAGHWGSLCGLFFREDAKGADVVCRQLGYARSSGAPPEVVNREHEREVKDSAVTKLGTACATGNESSLAGCVEHDDLEKNCRKHKYDVRITCEAALGSHVPKEYCELPPPPLGSGSEADGHGDEHKDKHHGRERHHREREHKEKEHHEREHHDRHRDRHHGHALALPVRETCDGAARLSAYPKGLVQTYDFAAGGWGNLCGLRFRENLAGPDVVCRELGYPEGALSVTTHDRSRHKDIRNSPLHLMAPVCNGSEAAVLECELDEDVKEGDCKDHEHDAEVECKGERVGVPGRADDDPLRFANHTDCAVLADVRERLQQRIYRDIAVQARAGKVKYTDLNYHIDQCAGFDRVTTPWTGDYEPEDWYCPPEDLAPTAEDSNPWCPDKYVQDGWMYWPYYESNRTLRQPECRVTCLPTLFKKVAYKHGLSYGTTCYDLGCRRPIGGFTTFGVHAYRFACDDVEEEQTPEPEEEADED